MIADDVSDESVTDSKDSERMGYVLQQRLALI